MVLYLVKLVSVTATIEPLLGVIAQNITMVRKRTKVMIGFADQLFLSANNSLTLLTAKASKSNRYHRTATEFHRKKDGSKEEIEEES